jgi:hypothetical protein
MGSIRYCLLLALAALVSACAELPTSAIGDRDGAGIQSAATGGSVLWGAVTFQRSSGPPTSSVAPVSLPDSWRYRDGVLVIENHGVASAVVRLDGVLIAGPSAFAPNRAEIRVPIDLSDHASLEVEVRGARGGELSLRVEAMPLTEDELIRAVFERFILTHLPHPQYAGGGEVPGTHMWFRILDAHRVKVMQWSTLGAGFVADIDAEVEYSLLVDDVYVPHYHRMPLRIAGVWAIYGVPHGVDPETTPFIEWMEVALGVFSAAHNLGVRLELVEGVPVQTNPPQWPE